VLARGGGIRRLGIGREAEAADEVAEEKRKMAGALLIAQWNSAQFLVSLRLGHPIPDRALRIALQNLGDALNAATCALFICLSTAAGGWADQMKASTSPRLLEEHSRPLDWGATMRW